MRGILADINILGHLAILLHVWESEEWRELWEHLALSLHTFEEWGLNQKTPDDVIWKQCQAHQTVLLTANRNDDGPDSLEAAIRKYNSPDSLPVFTFANAERIQHERKYAAQVAIGLLQYFLEIDVVRGVGRLYVP